MPQPRHDRGLDEAIEISAQLRPVYDKLHRDLESMVQKEVARFAAETESEVKTALADIARRGGIRRAGLAWPKSLPRPAYVLVSALVMVLIVAWMRPDWIGLGGGAATTTPQLVSGEPVVPAADNPPDEPAPADPAARIREYDDLFGRHSDRFAGLVAAIRRDRPGDEKLEGALQAWEHESRDTTVLNVVHSALVQAALKQNNAAIVIDGEINRTACTGVACRTIKALWEADQNGFGFLPAYPAPLKPEDLRSIEKILVMGRLGAR